MRPTGMALRGRHGSLAPDEYRSLLAELGFTLVDHRLRDPDCGEATLWLARRTG
jgi:hypothetical protein